MVELPKYLNNVKILVTDLDNTLFFSGTDKLPTGFTERLNCWREQGGLWIIATGRPEHRLRDFYQEWDLYPDYYIALERYIYRCFSDGSEFPFISWNNKVKNSTNQLQANFSVMIKPVLNWARELDIEVEREEFWLRFEREDRAREAEQILIDNNTEDYIPLRNRVYLGFLPRIAGKGSCLDFIATARDWQRDAVLCVGDSANDIDMLDGRFAFKSAAVADAEPSIRKTVHDNAGVVFEEPSGRAIVSCLEYLLACND